MVSVLLFPDTGYLSEEVSKLTRSCSHIPIHRVEADMRPLAVLAPPSDQQERWLPVRHHVSRMWLPTVLAEGTLA